MTSVDVDFANGMQVEVTYTRKRYPSGPGGPEEVEETDTGEITAVPSRKFDEWDAESFDYTLEVPSGDGTTRSVNLDREVVCDLHYDSGFDKDWDTFQLESIRVTG